MQERGYTAPSTDRTGFHCPHCGVKCAQKWYDLYGRSLEKTPYRPDWDDINYWEGQVASTLDETKKKLAEKNLRYVTSLHNGDIRIAAVSSFYVGAISNLYASQCSECSEIALWMRDKLTYPVVGEVTPHPDLPNRVADTFNEAAKVLEHSPRASAALSRLALQQLCEDLGCEENYLDGQIAELVARGLSLDIQQMLDGIRVIGNNAVHPLEIDISEDNQTPLFLLECINRICQRLITEKQEAEKLYEMLPPGAKEKIEKRTKRVAEKMAPEK